MNCKQCSASRINGVFVHEKGCPNEHKVWRGGEWVRLVKCRECGTEYNPDDEVCCAEEGGEG